MMKDPMLVSGAADPRFVWIGYPDVAAPDRFAVVDEKAALVYLYVPLDTACRWLAAGRADKRNLMLHFHKTAEDDARLSSVQAYYSARVARSLDLWDHAPKGRYRNEEAAG